MSIRRVLGNAFIGIGVLNALNFYAPRPIPTVGVSAFVVGALFVAAGLLLRGAKERTDRVRWNFADSSALAVRVLRLAKEKRGRLTVTVVAMELDVSLDEAEAALEECVTKAGAAMETDPATGSVSFRFPEFEAPSS